MAERKVYIGSVGPFLFEDNELINDLDEYGNPTGDFDGQLRHALVSDRQTFITEAPSLDEHMMRLGDANKRLLDPLVVTDINDPSTELGGKSGIAGTLILVYQVKATKDEATLYEWETANSDGVDIPYVVAGSSGFWVAVAGTNYKIKAKHVVIPDGVGTPSYDDMQDFLNLIMASGMLVGGDISASATSGAIDIAEMQGMIHTTTDAGSPLIYFKKAAYEGLVLNDGEVNFIWLTMSAGTLTYSANNARPTNDYSVFVVGRAWRLGSTVEVVSTGQTIFNMYGRQQDRLLTKYGSMEHAKGGFLSAHGTALRLTCSAGTWYFGNTPISTAEVNIFKVWYKSGSATWIKSSELTLFSEIFNGTAAKVYEFYQNGDNLASLIANKYGIYWIFLCPEGELYLLLGTASYTNIGAAQAATVPTSLPPYLVDWGELVGRVICKKSAAALYSVESIFEVRFDHSATIDHNSTGGKQGGAADEYYHLLAAEYTELSEWLDDVTLGSDGLTSVPEMVLVPRAAALSDVVGGMFFSNIDTSIYVCTSL